MDSKRFILALTLSVAVMFVVSTIFPPATPEGSLDPQADSALVTGASSHLHDSQAAGASTGSTIGSAGSSDSADPASSDDSLSAAIPLIPTVATLVGDNAADSGAVFTMNSVGASPSSVKMNAYNFATTPRSGEPVTLEVPGQSLLKYQVVANNGARLDLSQTNFAVTEDGNILTYSGAVDGKAVTIQYLFVPDSHIARVRGSIEGQNEGYLVVSLPTTLPATEKDTAHDRSALAYVYNSKREGATRVTFKSLDPGERKTVEGPVNWIAVKTKYFVLGVLAEPDSGSFAEATLVGGPRTSSTATNAEAALVVPLTGNGEFTFDMYAGPQEWKRLNSLGRDFDEVNPYGWAFLRGILQPIATMVIRLVLWMHTNLNLSYGMVLIALGLLIRIILWPLNQTAMKSSLRMQELQPELQATQKRFKDDPVKLREEITKVYASHGMSPFTPVLGCLPMLIPMPILLTLFFVFQNTIEFRGVSFLWVNDLSVYDPLYVWPVLMAISMFILSWIGARNAPNNPQTKMMMYFMPVVMLFILSRMAAGLNVYYAAQNFAALPQQWLISREQAKRRALRGSAPVATATPSASSGKAEKAPSGRKRKARKERT